jgi:hypothetical protein
MVENNTIRLYCDNQNCCKTIQNPIFHVRMKHIKVNYHLIHEKGLFGEIDLEHVLFKSN